MGLPSIQLPSLLKQCIRRYEEGVTRNAASIASFEGTLRTLLYALPPAMAANSDNAELATETGLLGLYHDHILRQAADRNGSASWRGSSVHGGGGTMDHILARLAHLQSPHKLPRGASKKDTTVNESLPEDAAPCDSMDKDSRGGGLYRKAAMIWSMTQYCQVFVELAAQRRNGSKGKWRVVFMLECIKLLLWRGSGYRRSLSRALPDRPVVDPNGDCFDSMNDNDTETCKFIGGRRCLKAYPTLRHIRSFTNNDTRHESNVDTLDAFLRQRFTNLHAQDPLTALPKLGDNAMSVERLVEFLYILRPCIYVALLMRYGKQSWKPWITSLAIEVACHPGTLSQCLRRVSKRSTRDPPLSPCDEMELGSRQWLWAFYALRAPFLDKVTRPILDATIQRYGSVPLIGMILRWVQAYETLWEQSYFYTSGT